MIFPILPFAKKRKTPSDFDEPLGG